MKALVCGETIGDVFPEEQVTGGVPFNFAAHLAHLGNETYLISAVGKDELGEKALAIAAHHGVMTDLIQENSYKTGAFLVTLDEEGHFLYDLGLLSKSDADLPPLPPAPNPPPTPAHTTALPPAQSSHRFHRSSRSECGRLRLR